MAVKKRVFAIGGYEENNEVEFTADIDAAEEIWIYEQEISVHDEPVLSPDAIKQLRDAGKNIIYRDVSFFGMSVKRNITKDLQEKHSVSHHRSNAKERNR